MKVIIGDAIVNIDQCSVIDAKVFPPGEFSAENRRFVLRSASMPICDLPTATALKCAMDSIKLAIREGFDWIELNPDSGHYLAFGRYIHSRTLIDQLSRWRQQLRGDVQHFLACGAWPEEILPARENG